MSAELLNCPFCGGGAEFVLAPGQKSVVCVVRCGGMTRYFDNEEVAVKSWNTRTPDLSFLDKPEAFEKIREAIWTVSWDRTESVPFKFPTGETMIVNSQKFEIEEIVNSVIAAIKRMVKEGV